MSRCAGIWREVMERRKRSGGPLEQFASKSRRISSGSKLHEDVENSIPESKTLYGREKEVTLLENFLLKGIISQCPVSIFISGPPGTGKTLAVKTVLNNMLLQHNVHSTYINCASENTERDILIAVLNDCSQSNKKHFRKKMRVELQKELAEMKKHIIVILDEIDYVKPKDLDFVCSMFQWPVVYKNVSLIGIANTLDVIALPTHKLKCAPELIVFAPYTEAQLQLILSKKLRIDKDSNAVELCARKIAAMTGDARKAMQVARRSLSLKSSNEGTPCRNVLGTLSSVYSSPLLQMKIPLQQKILLATMLRLADINSSSTIEKGCLLSTYKKLCGLLFLPALDMDEIYEALSLLESQSILKLKPSSYQLLVDKAVARKIIADTALISQINTLSLRND
uniref:AAA+ ATPase domain-containing protein n=1 Tax=Setaria digitata TaxID=48799 RepID=A0A915PLE9_9BILA